jgi:acyl dehydratase
VAPWDTAVKAGDAFGPSRWVDVGQERVDRFVAVTDDAEWIQANRSRVAGRHEGAGIVPGFLTLSLLAGLWFEVTEAEGHPLTINYGLNRVRFPAPLPVGSRVRASFRVDELAPAGDGEQALITATVEADTVDRPVCVAELVFRFLS